MTEWVEASLGEIADVLVGFAFKSAQFTCDPGDLRLLRGVNISQGRLTWDHLATLPAHLLHDDRYRLGEGDVVLAMDRPWIEAGLKRARVRPEDLPSLLVQRVARLRGTDRATTSYVHHVLATQAFSAYLRNVVTGATVPHISQSQIEAFRLGVPPMRVQAQICEVLDAFDELVENNRRRVEVLEEMARAIYREWFVHFRYPGHENVPVVDSPLGPMPAGWVALTLGESGKWLSGGTPKTSVPEYWGGPIPWITSGTLTSTLLDRSERTLTAAGAANGTKVVDRDTVLFVVRGMSLVSEFRVGIADVQLAFGQDCKAIVAADGLHPLYLGFTLIDRAEDIQRMVELAGHGTGKLSTDRLKALPLAQPPAEVQRAFVKHVSPLRDSMTAARLATDRLQALHDLLLPKVVTGQIDVSSLDLDGLVGQAVA